MTPYEIGARIGLALRRGWPLLAGAVAFLAFAVALTLWWWLT